MNEGDVTDRGLDAESALFDGYLESDDQLSSNIVMKKVLRFESPKLTPQTTPWTTEIGQEKMHQ